MVDRDRDGGLPQCAEPPRHRHVPERGPLAPPPGQADRATASEMTFSAAQDSRWLSHASGNEARLSRRRRTTSEIPASFSRRAFGRVNRVRLCSRYQAPAGTRAATMCVRASSFATLRTAPTDESGIRALNRRRRSRIGCSAAIWRSGSE